MAFLTYCTQSDIENIFSYHGVLYAVDDDVNGTLDTSNDDARIEPDYIANCVERATLRINQFVAQLYDLRTLPANKWIKNCCATIAAYFLSKRRGASPPESLEDEYQELVDYLKQILNGDLLIPKNENASSDAQLLVSNAGMAMSNMTLDLRFPVAKIRSVQKISSGDQSSVLPRRPDYRAIRFLE